MVNINMVSFELFRSTDSKYVYIIYNVSDDIKIS